MSKQSPWDRPGFERYVILCETCGRCIAEGRARNDGWEEIDEALDPGPVPSSWRGRRAARNPAVEAQIACLCLAGLFLFLAIVWMVTP